MPISVKPIPEGFHTIQPGLVVRNAVQAIDFYKKALGAQEISRMPGPDGKIMHAELKIGDSVFFLSEENPNMGFVKSPQTLGGSTVSINVYVPDVDQVFKQAISSGAKESMPVADQFWGDRYGSIADPFGYVWGIATHKENLSNDEIQKRARNFFAEMAQKKTA
ncbi:MAG TPA: VOC family protein [Candidatus Angelobacter sp.]|nr:VOC family protein [Candidatus Angelobacter sp.]